MKTTLTSLAFVLSLSTLARASEPAFVPAIPDGPMKLAADAPMFGAIGANFAVKLDDGRILAALPPAATWEEASRAAGALGPAWRLPYLEEHFIAAQSGLLEPIMSVGKGVYTAWPNPRDESGQLVEGVDGAVAMTSDRQARRVAQIQANVRAMLGQAEHREAKTLEQLRRIDRDLSMTTVLAVRDPHPAPKNRPDKVN